MRSSFCLVIMTLLYSGLAQAGEKQEAEAILAKGIQALGGEAKLSKYQAATWRSTTKAMVLNREVESTEEMALQWPGRIRAKSNWADSWRLDIVNEGKGWRQTDQGTKDDLDQKFIFSMQGAICLEWIPVTLLPLKQKDFKLAVGGEGKIACRPAVSVEVTPRRGPAFELFFDKEKGLPLKMGMRVNDLWDGTEYSFAWLYSDYKEVQGIKKAMKIVIKEDYGEGKTSSETRITEFKFFDKLDDKLFTKP